MRPPCPACGSTRTRSARTYANDSLRHRLFHSVRRCRDCRHRYWLFNPVKPLLAGLAMLALVGPMVWLALPARESAVAVSPSNRIDNLRSQAEKGDPEAQLKMGVSLINGDGLEISLNKAVEWFTKAAEQGNVEAQYQLGSALLDGRGTAQDYQGARRWFEAASRRGHIKSQVALADIYRYGSGVPIDFAQAYLWYNVASAQGDANAARSRDNVASRLEADTLARMQSEARTLLVESGMTSGNTTSPATPPPGKSPILP